MRTIGIALVLFTFIVSVPVSAQAPEAEVDLETVMRDFGRAVSDFGVTFMMFHLNDVTTDALFDVPLKYSLRAQARANTMFYIQGEADEDVELQTDFRVQQGVEHFQARLIDIENFAEGQELEEGDQFRGIIAIEKLFDPKKFIENMQGIRVHYVGQTYFFDFPADVVAQLP